MELVAYLFFLAVPGLHCFAQAFSSCGERRLLFIEVRGVLIVVASLVTLTCSRLTGVSGWAPGLGS